MLRNVLAVSVSAALALGTARACGPDFPLELLANRTQTLQGMPSGEFFFETAHLVDKPKEKWNAELDLQSGWFEASAETPVPEAQEKIETDGFSPGQIDAWRVARAAGSAAEAMAAAAALPAADQHYLAGAAAFRAGDFDGAANAFAMLADLGDAGKSRVVWAEFMLGRIRAISEPTQAIMHFEKTRALAASGLPDPLGLAVASLGAEARLSWTAVQEGSGDSSQNLARAVELYAQQAAAGSQSGSASLLIVARSLNADAELLQTGLQLPLVRKLMTSYAFARGYEAMDDAQTEAFGQGDYVNPNLAGGLDKALIAPPLLDAILAAAPTGKLEGADRFAAALYRAGRFDQAVQFAKASDSPLAHWVRAKLALRAGDQKQAASEYAVVIKSMAKEDAWIPNSGGYELMSARCRVQGEAGTLAMSQGDFLQALEQFYLAGDDYGNDMSYIAERVISTEELLRFVEANTKPQPLQKVAATEYSAEYFDVPFDEQTGIREKGYQAHQLRKVLARRLMREGQFEKALTFFNDPTHLEAAKKYGAAMGLAESAAGIKKAEALFAVATLARETGIDILGFELAPDYAVYGGSYGDYEPTEEERKENPSLYLKPTALITAKETDQLKLTLAKPDKRFHYRYTAVALAEQAADLVPARSQAFAAMLCTATRWVIYRDQTEGQRLYQRYLKQGPYVPWGGVFGTTQDCPAPEFGRAQAMLDQQTLAARKKMLKKALPYAVGGFGLLLGLGVFLWLRNRKPAATI